jgi:hypothetical protein
MDSNGYGPQRGELQSADSTSVSWKSSFTKWRPEETDYQHIRDEFIRLPDCKTDGYRRALLLGTTGAGKTALGWQLIGTAPRSERSCFSTVTDSAIPPARGGPAQGVARPDLCVRAKSHQVARGEPSEEEKQLIFDTFADAIARRMLVLATPRVWKERGREWQNAYDKHGKGSTYVRADIIGTQILDPAAPIPDLTPSIDRNQFLRDVAEGVKAAADECEAVLA